MFRALRFAVVLVTSTVVSARLGEDGDEKNRRKLQAVAPPQSLWSTGGNTGGYINTQNGLGMNGNSGLMRSDYPQDSSLKNTGGPFGGGAFGLAQETQGQNPGFGQNGGFGHTGETTSLGFESNGPGGNAFGSSNFLPQQPSGGMDSQQHALTEPQPGHDTSSQLPVESTGGSCSIREAREVQVSPTWTAAFPGSGIKILWQTIEQLTGITTSDDNDSNGRLKKGTCVTVKTHYPSPHVSPKFFYMDTSKLQYAILLMRNPLMVLPSYFKFLYRFEFNNGPDAEVPVDKWVAWRNENYAEQLEKWVEHTQWWVKNYGAQGKLMVLPFEHFTDPEKGPETLKQMGIFLGQVDQTTAANLVPENELPCLWEKTVAKSAPPEYKDPKMRKKLMQMPPKYPFTIDQMDKMMQAIKQVKREFDSVPQVNGLLDEYTKQITATKRAVQKLLDG